MNTIRNALKVESLRKRIVFTLLMLAIFGIGSNLPVPGINHEVLDEIFNGQNAGLFDLFNLFTGGSFQNFTMFALGVTPYITASIIIQLLTIAFPYFENLAHEGEPGRKKMATITRYLALVLALVQACGLTLGLFRRTLIDTSAVTVAMIILLLTAGTSFLMWLGEQINEYGLGNGMSLLIFAGIVSRLPIGVRDIYMQTKDGTLSIVSDIVVILAALGIVALVIYVQNGVRKIPLQYAKRTVGRKSFGGESTHIPLKVNAAGVIPIIFALSLLQFPLTMTYFAPQSDFAMFITKYLSPSGYPGVWVYVGLIVLLTVLFTYFYTNIVLKPDEIAKNLLSSGGSIPGIRPGKATEDYLRGINSRLTAISAVFLASIAVLPTCIGQFTPLNLTFGGTSILILVGVATETIKQIDTRLTANQYEGFLRKK